MRKHFILLIIIIGISSSCKEEVIKADAYGNFESNTTIVSSKAKGQLLKLDLEEGQSIQQGRLVAIIDTVHLHLQRQLLLSQKRSLANQTKDPQPEIEVLQSQLANLQRERQRVEKLVSAKAATTKQLDDINGEIEVVQRRMESAKQNASVANRAILSQRDPLDAQIDQVNAQIADSYVYNPIDGVVINKLVEPSEIVGFGMPLYTIADLSSMTLRVYADAVALQEVKVGDVVTVSIDGQAGSMNDMEGKVTWISTEAEFTPKIIQTKKERVNLVYAIKITVPNNGNLKMGMPAEVNFRKGSSSETDQK